MFLPIKRKVVSRLGTRPRRLKKFAPDVGRGKNGHKGGLPTWRTLKNARRSPADIFLALRNARWGPAGVFWHSKMLAGVPLAFFCPQKCSPGSRWHFLALKNARWGPADIFLVLRNAGD